MKKYRIHSEKCVFQLSVAREKFAVDLENIARITVIDLFRTTLLAGLHFYETVIHFEQLMNLGNPQKEENL